MSIVPPKAKIRCPMTRCKSIVIAGLIALGSLLPQTASAQITEGIAALVNDEPITTVDVRNRMRLIISSTGLGQLDEEALTRVQDQAIRGLVDEHLQLQAAAEYEIEISDEEILGSLEDLAVRNNATVDEIVTDLAASGVDVSTLRHQLEAEMAWQILVNGRFGSRIRISDQQIELVLERLAASASQPQFRIFEIFFEITTANGEEEAVQRVVGVMQQLQQGAPFPELARQFSDSSSAANGGDIGWIVASQLQPEVATIIPQLMQQYNASGGRGALSTPIRVPGGFMVVALVGARDGTTTLQYELTQITLPNASVNEDSQSELAAVSQGDLTCESAESAASGIEGAIVTPLGQISAGDLLPAIRDALEPLGPGENTGAIQTAAGLQTIIVCDRQIAGPGVPTRDDIEGQLRGQQLSLHSRRWLRDLRRESTIEIRN
ncbi:MAG: peptidylprolyl isomerase [Alphaproteobacteria bacterium]|nr:peptidylprolyl isomerase [Alphaproteobacteria bacterium]